MPHTLSGSQNGSHSSSQKPENPSVTKVSPFDRPPPTLNGEFINHRWFLNNKDGVPMVGLGITEGLVHSLYPEFANIMWDFAKHYARNPETHAIEYTAYID